MSLATRIESLVIRVAQEFNDVRAKAGNLANLTTTDKSNLVAAINELKAAVVSSAVIDDAHIAATTTFAVRTLSVITGRATTAFGSGSTGATAAFASTWILGAFIRVIVTADVHHFDLAVFVLQFVAHVFLHLLCAKRADYPMCTSLAIISFKS